MKTPQIIRSTATACVVAAAALMFTGCASTSADRAVSMSQNVVQTGKDLAVSSTAVSQSLTALNQLVTQPSGDMVGQYKSYLASVKSLIKTSDKVDGSISNMMSNSQTYFANWSNSIALIGDATLKQLSQERMQTATTNLSDLTKSIDSVRAAYKPLAKDLDDIGLYLGNNLTADGIAAMKPRLANIKTEALTVRDALAKSTTALNKFSGTLATLPPAK